MAGQVRMHPYYACIRMFETGPASPDKSDIT
uniref:Uncharacterized protein n=1 Tax=Peronospora matthiolae TaxID=2874970 RepID=A0AAV1VHZ1_9STRA